MLESKGLWHEDGLFVVFLESTIASLHDSVSFLQGFVETFSCSGQAFFPPDISY